MMMHQQQSEQATPKIVNKHSRGQVGETTSGPIGEAGKLAVVISQSPPLRFSLAEKLSRRKCDELTATTTTTTKASTTTSRQSDIAKRRSKKNSQIYKLLLTLNLFFFALVTPLVLCNSLGWLKEGQNFTTQIVYTIAYLNHALNFVFYGVSCKMYRSIVYDMFF